MYNFDILESTELGIERKGVKSFYNADGLKKASDWVREPLKGLRTQDCPQMTSALKWKNQDGSGSVTNNYIGYMLSNANSVQSNGTNVALFSIGIYKGHGFSVTPENFSRVVSLFAARKLINPNWLNEKDEYLVPQECEIFKQFQIDSIVLSLFNNSSEQSSLSDVEYKNQRYRIRNQFFWMSNKQVMDLASKHSFNSMMNQRFEQNSFVFEKLFGEENLYTKLSEDAKIVLDSATQLVIDSFEERENFSSYSNQLYNWDSGYAQLKLLWKEKYNDSFFRFRELYKNLEERMRPLVYELGFLKK